MERKEFIAASGGAPSPCYIIDEDKIAANAATLKDVQDRTGCKILLALKGFALYHLFPLISKSLPGIAASGVHEAQLGHDFFGGEIHTYSPAFKEEDIESLCEISDHIIFNSLDQWKRHREKVESAKKRISCGLRVNPEYSEIKTELYNPCAPCSRLGILRNQLSVDDLNGIDGLHFHALCEQDSKALENTLRAFEEKFSEFFADIKWVNFGGGHLITRESYDSDHLCSLIKDFKGRHPHLNIYLEPGEAIALDAGYLMGTIVDIVKNEKEIAILDISATTHMPDVLEMPYRPEIIGADKPGEKKYTYRLGGPSCLAGDFIGEYSFDEPLNINDRLFFTDMAHYTMVKNTTFNGIPLPAIGIYKSKSKSIDVIRNFTYDDYRMRLS